VGLGAPAEDEFAAVGEEADDKTRAEKLDEGLEIVSKLLSGELLHFTGKHYHLDGVRFRPRPFANRRIPVWVAGMLPKKAPFRRAARWNGVFPLKTPANGAAPFTWDQLWLSPAELREVVAYIRTVRHATDPFDVVATGATPNDQGKAADMTASFAEAGATWWLEWLDDQRGSFEEMRGRVLSGPPVDERS
jgi:alkanesulfonate monooxygenase SsuD/methylene tetrahydromethanopterin reductase-like flavin-dependent oxidoreductase (luciferase family)